MKARVVPANHWSANVASATAVMKSSKTVWPGT